MDEGQVYVQRPPAAVTRTTTRSSARSSDGASLKELPDISIGLVNEDPTARGKAYHRKSRQAQQAIYNAGGKIRRIKTNILGGGGSFDGQQNEEALIYDQSDQDLRLQRVNDIENGVVEKLLENQRGWFFFGFPIFSSNSLMPAVDPGPWTMENGQRIYGDKDAFMLPDLTWKWLWKRWYVDMSRDVDDQGWSYSIRFGSSSWHGKHIWLHSFVRRRYWVRLRMKRQEEDLRAKFVEVDNTASDSDLVTGTYTSEDSDREDTATNVSSLLVQLDEARIDRERINVLCKFVRARNNVVAVEAVKRYVDQVLRKFDFDVSVQHLTPRLQQVRDEIADDSEHRNALDYIISLIKDV